MSKNTQKMPIELYNKLKSKMEELRNLTVENHGIEVPQIFVKFDLTTHRALGKIRRHPERKGFYRARLNLDLLLEYKELYINEVVVHEFAHAVADLVHGQRNIKPHGKEWKEIAKVLGLKNPSATTGLFEVKRDMFIYECKCQEHYLTKRKHNKAQKYLSRHKKNVYGCLRCKTGLTLKGISNEQN